MIPINMDVQLRLPELFSGKHVQRNENFATYSKLEASRIKFTLFQWLMVKCESRMFLNHIFV